MSARPGHTQHGQGRIRSSRPTRRDRLVAFLVERLTDDLAALWSRECSHEGRADRPGLAAQVAVVDEALVTLRSGQLPPAHELRILLYGYGAHEDYDPTWVRLLGD